MANTMDFLGFRRRLYIIIYIYIYITNYVEYYLDNFLVYSLICDREEQYT